MIARGTAYRGIFGFIFIVFKFYGIKNNRMIRYPIFRRSTKHGLSLLELIFVLLIVGVVLSTLWLKAGTVFHNWEVTKAVEQLQNLVLALRNLHQFDKVTESENIDLLNLPPTMLGRFREKTIIVSPWRSPVTIFPGNAAGWGGDIYNDEMTIRFDGVPSTACQDFVMRATYQMKNFGFVAVYISPRLAEGSLLCVVSDGYCRNKVKPLDENEVQQLCSQKNFLTIMFTLSSH